MIRTILDILMLSAGAIVAALMLLFLAGAYTPVFDWLMALGVLTVALGAMMTAINSLAGNEP
jgi:hypothetical protein